MKKYISAFFLVLVFLAACSEKKPIPIEIVSQYYQGFEDGNFDQIKKVIGDSILIKSGDYISSYSRSNFYEFFKWDSVLLTKKKLAHLKDSNDAVIATITYSSERYEFLGNNHMTCTYRVDFKGNKISMLEELDCPDANWQEWENQVNSLVSWIKEHHPELDGFINDLTMNGAINYMKAMELYKNRVQL